MAPRACTPLDDAAAVDAVRASFPYLERRTYLDTAAAGLCWNGHGHAVARFYDEVKSRGFDARPEWLAKVDTVRAKLASLLSTGDADITFVSNTTEGLNHASNSLSFGPGDTIVLADDEFPSVSRIWAAAQRAGARLVPVRIPSEPEREAALMAAVDGRTRVLAVSHTHSSTGTTVDLSALGRFCRQRDVLLMVDGIQALGAVPTDLAEVDIYAASFFKWMLSGFGIGILVTSTRARDAMRPLFQGYANLDDPQRLQYAHANTPALYGLDATLDFLAGIGWPLIHERVRRLGARLVDAGSRYGLDLVTPPGRRAGIVVFRCDGEAARRRLDALGISASARGEGVRVSPHFYNTAEEVDRCARALAGLDIDP